MFPRQQPTRNNDKNNNLSELARRFERYERVRANHVIFLQPKQLHNASGAALWPTHVVPLAATHVRELQTNSMHVLARARAPIEQIGDAANRMAPFK